MRSTEGGRKRMAISFDSNAFPSGQGAGRALSKQSGPLPVPVSRDSRNRFRDRFRQEAPTVIPGTIASQYPA
ncbi:hypothetical protein JCM33774_72440 [Actinophytocola sp. KF-1]